MKIINLLPRYKQEELRYEDLFHSVLTASAMAFAILIAVLVGQIGLRFYLGYSARSLQHQADSIRTSTNKAENNQLKEKIRLNNAQMNDYKVLTDAVPNWSKVLLAFAQKVPQEVTITTMSAEANTRKVLINGQSPTREAVIELYNNINADTEHFEKIDYPLENVAKPTDVTFHYTFYIKEEALK